MLGYDGGVLPRITVALSIPGLWFGFYRIYHIYHIYILGFVLTHWNFSNH